MILLVAILLAVFLVPSPWSWVVLVVGCILEVGEVAFLRRWSKRIGRRTKVTTGAEAMLGRTATVMAECRPKGTVRIDGQIWEAHCRAGAASGDTVRITALHELTLEVAPTREASSHPASTSAA
jgi:membrane-bound serine protease (ClpP class)